RVAASVARFKAQPPPEGTDATAWAEQKARALAEAQDNINYVQYSLFNAAYRTREPAARVAMLERFVVAFPDSPYSVYAQDLHATTYHLAPHYPKMPHPPA